MRREIDGRRHTEWRSRSATAPMITGRGHDLIEIRPSGVDSRNPPVTATDKPMRRSATPSASSTRTHTGRSPSTCSGMRHVDFFATLCSSIRLCTIVLVAPGQTRSFLTRVSDRIEYSFLR